jgi:hypothetical protein
MLWRKENFLTVPGTKPTLYVITYPTLPNGTEHEYVTNIPYILKSNPHSVFGDFLNEK